jgi:HSP20 family protein
MYNTFDDVSTNLSKELVREYQTPEGEKIREVGPIVYGYSMTIGPDGKPHVREFGNIKSPGSSAIKEGKIANNQQILAESL